MSVATVVVGDTVDFLTVDFRDAAEDDRDGVDAAVLVVTRVVGVAVPVLVVVFGAFVVLTIVVIDAVDIAALFFPVTVTMVWVSVAGARRVVWNAFGFRLPVVVMSTEEEPVRVASAVFVAAGVFSATAVIVIVSPIAVMAWDVGGSVVTVGFIGVNLEVLVDVVGDAVVVAASVGCAVVVRPFVASPFVVMDSVVGVSAAGTDSIVVDETSSVALTPAIVVAANVVSVVAFTTLRTASLVVIFAFETAVFCRVAIPFTVIIETSLVIAFRAIVVAAGVCPEVVTSMVALPVVVI